MIIAPLPAFIAYLRFAGFTASFSTEVAHDSPAGPLGEVGAFTAAGPVTLANGDIAGLAGDQGGLFGATYVSGAIVVSFDRNSLGDDFAEGETLTTHASLPVTDGQSTTVARIRVTVRRAFTPPTLLTPIPDQMDMLP